MQYLFHRKFTIFKEPLRAQAMFMVDDERENVDTIIKRLEAMGIEVSRIKIEKKDENNFQLKCDIILPRKMERDDFTSRIEEISNFISYEV